MKKLVERKGDFLILDRSDPHAFDGKCEMCGKVDDLRPYGPKGENICYDCGMKDEAAATRAFHSLLDNAKEKPS